MTWQTKKLWEVLVKTETINPLLSPNTGFTYIDVSSVSNETFTIENTTKILGKNAPSRARKKIKAGDIIFATVRPTLKRIAIVPKELDGQVCSTGYFVLRVSEKILNRLVYYYLLSDDFSDMMEKLQKGASYPAVTDGNVKHQLISFPESLSEQKRIVKTLDDVFEKLARAKENAEKNLQNSKELFESYLQSVFANPGKDWEENRLKEIADLFDSLHITPKYVQDGYPMVRVTDIKPGFLNLTKTKKVDKKTFDDFSKKHKPKIGDIVFSRVGSYGVSSIVNTEALFCLGQNTVFIVPNIDSRFFYYFLNSPNSKNQIDKFVAGTTQPTISLSSIKEILVPTPTLAQQKSIVKKLDALSTETKKLEKIYEQKLADLDELKKSILQKAFKGEL